MSIGVRLKNFHLDDITSRLHEILVYSFHKFSSNALTSERLVYEELKYAPVAIYIATSGGVRGQVLFLSLDLLPMLAISIALGCVLIVLSYRYCKKGVENLIAGA